MDKELELKIGDTPTALVDYQSRIVRMFSKDTQHKIMENIKKVMSFKVGHKDGVDLVHITDLDKVIAESL